MSMFISSLPSEFNCRCKPVPGHKSTPPLHSPSISSCCQGVYLSKHEGGNEVWNKTLVVVNIYTIILISRHIPIKFIIPTATALCRLLCLSLFCISKSLKVFLLKLRILTFLGKIKIYILNMLFGTLS